MEKKNNHYKIKFEETALKEQPEVLKSLEFEFENHDDIFKIMEVVEAKDLFENKNDSVEFSLGLKLFSEVMIRNRKHPLFEELMPAFGAFMKKLKQQ
jgi:hypothetical protein